MMTYLHRLGLVHESKLIASLLIGTCIPYIESMISESVQAAHDPLGFQTGGGTVLVDYKGNDYRGFIFVTHETHGFLLLYCTRKKDKPPHFQLCGGHIDDPEFLLAAEESSDRKTQLEAACKRGAARELFEETGIDIRSQLDRLKPVTLRKQKDEDEKLVNEYKHRLFFSVLVFDDDFPKRGTPPMTKQNLKLKISHEHSAYTFQPDATKLADMLRHHSGGKISEVVKMALEQGSIRSVSGARSETMTTSEAQHAVKPSPAPPTPRRSKYERDRNLMLPPPKEKKSPFCCFNCC